MEEETKKAAAIATAMLEDDLQLRMKKLRALMGQGRTEASIAMISDLMQRIAGIADFGKRADALEDITPTIIKLGGDEDLLAQLEKLKLEMPKDHPDLGRVGEMVLSYRSLEKSSPRASRRQSGIGWRANTGNLGFLLLGPVVIWPDTR